MDPAKYALPKEENMDREFLFSLPAPVILEETGSTNRVLREKASLGPVPDGLRVIARKQTAGRGRLGRDFFSPSGTGLYMSVFFEARDAGDALRYTLISACAVCLALEEQGLKPGIKWVNDIYLGSKKLCGILCEKAPGGVVCGIGLNLKTPEGGFPEELRDIACALDNGTEALSLADRILYHFLLLRQDDARVLSVYRERMFLTGRSVTLPDGEQVTVLGVSDRGGLLVTGESGRQKELISGEVTLHGAALPPQR